MINQNAVLREVRRIQSEYNRNGWIGGIGLFALIFGILFLFMGLVCLGIPVTAIGVLCLTVSTLGAKSINGRTQRYASQELFLPKFKELFQIYEFNPDKEMPRYLAEQVGVIQRQQKYQGFCFLRAAYRGAVFMASEYQAIRDRRNRDKDNEYRPTERNARLLYDRNISSTGVLARVDLNYHVNGYLKIEGHSRDGVLSGVFNTLKKFEAEALGAKVYDFSGVNPEFQKRFRITTTDENFAQQLLTASMMQRLLEVAPNANGYIKLIFTDDNLFYINNSDRYYFGVHGAKYTEQHLMQDMRAAENEVYTFTNIMDIFIEKAPFIFFR